MTPIIYLHGFAPSPASSKARYFAHRLRAAGAMVEIPDLADGDFEHLTISGQLRVVERVAAGRAVSLVGSSMGGYLSALYAAEHPEVERLVLLAPAFCFARRWQERMGDTAIREWRERGTVEVFHYGDGCTRQLAFDLLDDAGPYPDFPDFRQPALIFHGRHDDVVPAAFSEEFATKHANAKLEVLDSGHELINVLDYMAPKVLQFLTAG